MKTWKRIAAAFGAALALLGMFPYDRHPVSAAANEWDFSYSGKVEEFTAPYTGKYLLDTYGASGGGNKSGGGHSFGYINLYKGEKLYVSVGEQGKLSPASGWSDYTYNGGGRAYGGAGSGGGATAITRADRGELKNFEQHKKEVVMAAGGSGGIGSSWRYSAGGCYVIDDYLDKGMYAFVRFWDSTSSTTLSASTPSSSTLKTVAGEGGGLQGAGCQIRTVDGIDKATDGRGDDMPHTYLSTGGDSVGGGYSFGQGGNGSNISNGGYGGAGGGGFYGGYAYDKQPKDGSGYRSVGILFGAGGCGYLSSELYEMASVSNANIGNGKAKITYAGEVTSNYIIDIGDIGTIGGKSGTVDISGKVGTTGTIPQVRLKDGYRIVGWDVEYNECNTDIRPSATGDVALPFTFGDIRISPKFTAPISSEIQKVDDTTYDLSFTEEDAYNKIYAISESYDNGITYYPVSASENKNDLTIHRAHFNYVGSVQEWKAPISGNWLIEVSGGSAASYQQTRTGGYARGYKRVKKGDSLFIACGGAGAFNTAGQAYIHGVAGWNGGGYGWTNSNHGPTRWIAGSGGATSVTTTNRGVLANFKSYKNEVVIVAGGAGCSPYAYYSNGSAESCFLDWRPGSQKPLGGGLVGGSGAGGSAGGGQNDNGYFGQGMYYSSRPGRDIGAGGGGWYGGTLGSADEPVGGGGSSYLGGVTNGQTILGGAKTFNGSADMTYEKAFTENTKIQDLHMTDKVSPNTPSSGKYESKGNNLVISWKDNGDRGSNIIFRIQSFTKDAEDFSENEMLNEKLLNYSYTSGVKGFYYYIDTVATGTADTTKTFSATASIEIPVSDTKRYLHVAAIDNAGNLSGTYNMEIPSVAKYMVNHYAQNEDGTYTLVKTEEKMGTIGTSVTPDIIPQTGRDNPEKQSVTVTADGKAHVDYYYDVTRFTINGTVFWNDHENLYGTRPDSIGVTLYRDEKTLDYVTVPAPDVSNKYQFTGLQKYDLTTGRELSYTTKQDVAYSQAALVSSEDKYQTKQSGYDFLNTIRNTEPASPDEPNPDNPDDKGFFVEGSIYWDDNGDSLGFRPSEVTITLYQKGEDGKWKPFMEPIIVDAFTENHYGFEWLPKYWYDKDDSPTAYEYKVEETFVSWYVEDGIKKDAYTVIEDQPEDYDFTNVFNKPAGPVIPVNEYVNTITVKTNTDEQVRIILKPFELFIGDDYSVSYGGLTRNDIPMMSDNTGTTIHNIPGTKYEIVVDSPEYTLGDIKLSLSENMGLEEIEGKWYVTIKNVPADIIGTLEIELSRKEPFYQGAQRMMNYFASRGGAAKTETEGIRKMSKAIAVPDIPVLIEYVGSDTVDGTVYMYGEKITVLDYLGIIPAGSEFAGWSTEEGSDKAEYLPGDIIIPEDNVTLFPVFDKTDILSDEDSGNTEESSLVGTQDRQNPVDNKT